MKVLVIGGTGFIGKVLIKKLEAIEGVEPISASRYCSPGVGGREIQLDAEDLPSVERALQGIDAVVNCVTGSTKAIENSATALHGALSRLPSGSRPKIVHLSTMSVYGSQGGLVSESCPLQDDLGWYGAAKISAEQDIRRCQELGAQVYMLRPGCVYGPGSTLWTDRLARLLRSGRLGDIAELGDGWSNLVHVNDVAEAIVHCLLDNQVSELEIYNLSAPDSPRWNQYFADLAQREATLPIKYLTSRRMKIETLLLAPPLKVTERLCAKARISTGWLPDGIAPSLLKLWGQQIKLDSTAIEQRFDFVWTSYKQGALGC